MEIENEERLNEKMKENDNQKCDTKNRMILSKNGKPK